MKLMNKYLISESDTMCPHCKKNKPAKGKTCCDKCSKELETFRNKNSKKGD